MDFFSGGKSVFSFFLLSSCFKMFGFLLDVMIMVLFECVMIWVVVSLFDMLFVFSLFVREIMRCL